MTRTQRWVAAGALIALGGAALLLLNPRGGDAQTTVQAGTVQYSYDSVGHLVQDSYPVNSLTYSYDNANNRTQANVQ